MKVSNYAGDHEYLSSRISGSVVMCQGSPVYVLEVTGSGNASIEDLVTHNRRVIRADNLSLEIPKLGYVNYFGRATYVCRKPMRRDYKQGLRKQNLISTYGYISNELPYHSLVPTLTNNYPSFKECLNLIQNQKDRPEPIFSMAWNRNWAIEKEGDNLHLLYKFGTVVGSIINGEPTLKNEFMYLIEQLMEVC